MNQRNALIIYCLISLMTAASVAAQTIPFNSGSVALGRESFLSAVATVGVVTPISVTADPSAAGGDFIDVITQDPAIVVSLVLPNGTQVTAANAASLNFDFQIDSGGSADIPSPSIFSLNGTHTLITFLTAQAPGAYTIKLDATNASNETAVLAIYSSSSNVKAGLIVDAPLYKPGDTVVLSAFAFDGSAPITNATVTASLSAPISLTGQTSIGGYTLVSSAPASTMLTFYTYGAAITNTSGQTLTAVTADIGSLPAGVGLEDGGTLIFGDVASGATIASSKTFTISRNPNIPFNPTSLAWNPMSPGTPSSVTLVDSGTFDDATGDGIYTGTFIPNSAGNYTAIVKVTGTSAAGNAFVRTVGTSFRVAVPPAGFGQFQEASFDDDQNGMIDRVVETANVSVQTAGTYLYSLQLTASNGKSITTSTQATLAAGSQQVSVTFSAADLLSLGVDGPYQRQNATLTLSSADDEVVAAYQASAGQTAAFSLSKLQRDSVVFTGSNSDTGRATPPATLLTTLVVQYQVYTNVAGPCSWTSSLSAPSGTQIDSTRGNATFSSGLHFITIFFSGNKIANAGANGPYSVRTAVICGGPDFISAPVYQTAAYTASQFAGAIPTFTLTASPVSLVAGGASVFAPLSLTVGGGLTGTVAFSVSALPTGVTGAFTAPALSISGKVFLQLTAAAGTSLGTSSITISYTNGTTSKTLSMQVTVTSAPIKVTASGPASVALGSTAQFSAAVSNTTNQTVTWSTGLGTIDSTGLYTPPATLVSSTITSAIATSALDASAQGFAVLNIIPQISVTPSTTFLGPGQSRQFSASLGGVVWSIAPSVGAIDSTGLYTAPSTISHSQIITATATTQGASPVANFATVTIAPISVSISPAGQTIALPATVHFSATVAGTTNTGVTWGIQPPTFGSIDSTGLYTPPASISAPTIIAVTAASNADMSKLGVMGLSVAQTDSIQSITVAPFSGAVFTGIVTSFFAAPSGGLPITLSSSLPSQTSVSATTVVSGGSRTTYPFTVTFSGHGTATLTATGPSNSQSTTVYF